MAQFYENDRLFPHLSVRGGRRQITLTGNLQDLFFVDLAHGAHPLGEALRLYGQRRGYEVVLFVDATGKIAFARPDMQGTYEDIVRRVTEVPGQTSRGSTRVFTPRRGATENGDSRTGAEAEQGEEPPAAENEAADRGRRQASAAAPSQAQTTLDLIARLLRSSTKSLVIFAHPEKLWVHQPDEPALQKLESVLRWGAVSGGHRDNCSVLLVNPNRMEDFSTFADRCIDRSNFSRQVQVGSPGRPELEHFAQRLMYRHALAGSPRQLAATAHAQELTLFQFSELILEHLARRPESKTLEDVFSADEQERTLEELIDDLQRLIGLTDIKQQVSDLIRTAEDEALRRRTGQDVSPLSYHMFFLGNPGTGKTIVARLLGRIFWALGIRSSRAFVEISSQDVISPYNEGDTLDRMRQSIQRAMGGVLFIDEVYVIAENEWGRKALEVLMKAMEDHRDNLTVIMAGYEEKLPELFKVNPGFETRVNHTFWFPDFTTDEMQQIFCMQCDDTGLAVSGGASEKVHRYIESCDRRGGLGNGRGARNLFEKVRTAVARSGGMQQRILPEHVPDPIRFREPQARRVLEQLDQDFIGLRRVKEDLQRLFVRQKGIERKGGSLGGYNHFLFLGGPGTGKTSVARKIGELFYWMGLVSEHNKLIEIDPIHDLTSQIQGEYATKVRDCFDRAKGGVLFIDEAYQLARDSQGPRVLDQIVKLMTEPKYRDLVVVMAGYPDEMQELLKSNPGLERRIAHRLHFDDFSADELCAVFYRCVERDGQRVATKDQPAFGVQLRSILDNKRQKRRFGNAGEVANFYENVVRVHQEMRMDKQPDADPHELRLADLSGEEGTVESVGSVLEELEAAFIGMEPLKQSIRKLASRIEFEKRRREIQPQAAGSSGMQMLNMRFVGSPGTGKTTIARFMARVLHALRMTQSQRVHECRGVDLKGSYLGQTKDRVNELFEKAAGELIIIDEVYSLYDPRGGQVDSFGQEAIDALVGNITDPRNVGTVIILAGYRDRLHTFLDANAGLASRFPFEIEFPNYSPEECLQILEYYLHGQSFSWPEAEPKFASFLLDYFRHAAGDPNFGNARTVGTVFEKIKGALAQRVCGIEDPKPEEYSRITMRDVLTLISD